MSLRLTQVPSEIASSASANSLFSQVAAEVIADLPILSNCRASQIAAEVLADFITPTLLVGGAFQDSEGNPLAFGKLRMQLNLDSTSPFSQQIVSTSSDIPLDANGNIAGTVIVWSNFYLKPADTRYFMTAFSARGQKAWGKWCVTIPPIDIYDVGTLTPQNQ